MNSSFDLLSSFLGFNRKSPTAFHLVKNAKDLLFGKDYRELREEDAWNDFPEKFLVIRDGALIAGKLNRETLASEGIKIFGAHSDSPSFKLKPRPLKTSHKMRQLIAEFYGGPLHETWKDRPLAIAGKICTQDNSGKIAAHLIDSEQAVCIIPNLAIHLSRSAEPSAKTDRQKNFNPLFGICNPKKEFLFEDWAIRQIADPTAREKTEKLLSHDLYLYNPEEGCVFGTDSEFFSCPRLDNQISCFLILQALIDTETQDNCLIVINDHEEIGSGSFTGAKGNFLQTVLERLVPGTEDYYRMIRRGFVISLDNAHAVHPHYPEKYDNEHFLNLNEGFAIKQSAGLSYASESELNSWIIKTCEDAKIPFQTFVNQNNIRGGSTIGPLTSTILGCRTADLGIPTLAMHSALETGGTKDLKLTLEAITCMMKNPFQQLKVQ